MKDHYIYQKTSQTKKWGRDERENEVDSFV